MRSTFIRMLVSTIFTFSIPLASALSVSLYSGKDQCTGGVGGFENIGVKDGCQKAGAGRAKNFINGWVGDADNDLLLVTYSDEFCCHANKVETFGWSDSCRPIKAFGSWRIIDPKDPDKGKKGEDYTC